MHACTRYLIAAILSCCDIARLSTRRSWTSSEESSNMQCLLWILKREGTSTNLHCLWWSLKREELRQIYSICCGSWREKELRQICSVCCGAWREKNFDKSTVFVVDLEERRNFDKSAVFDVDLKKELRKICSVCCGSWRENFDKSALCFLCLEEEESTSTALHWSSSYCAGSCVHSPIWIIVVPSDFWERPSHVMFVGPHDDNGCQWKAKRESSEKEKEKVAAPLSVYVSIAEHMHIHRGVMRSQCVASVPYFGGVPSSIAARCHPSICPGLSPNRHWRPRWFTKTAQKYHRYPPQCPTFSTLNKISCTSWSRCKVTSKQPNANYQRRHKSGGRSYYLLSTGIR